LYLHKYTESCIIMQVEFVLFRYAVLLSLWPKKVTKESLARSQTWARLRIASPGQCDFDSTHEARLVKRRNHKLGLCALP
jgi:hypothetical protein